MKVYTIHLIRHGITQGNLDGSYVGSLDMPLCDAGRSQLLEYKDKYCYPSAEVIFSSPMKRCVETVEILYGIKPAVIPDLREINFGDFEGKTAVDLADDPEYIKWIKGDMMFSPKNGESGEHFSKRVGDAFTKVIHGMFKTKTQSAVICTHGGVIMTVLAMFGLPQKKLHEWMTENGCGFTIQTDLKSWMRANLFEVTDIIPTGKEDVLISADPWMNK